MAPTTIEPTIATTPDALALLDAKNHNIYYPLYYRKPDKDHLSVVYLYGFPFSRFDELTVLFYILNLKKMTKIAPFPMPLTILVPRDVFSGVPYP